MAIYTDGALIFRLSTLFELMNNVFLIALGGKKERTFAYPCGNMSSRDGSYKEDLNKYFIAAKGFSPGPSGNPDTENAANSDKSLVAMAFDPRISQGLIGLLGAEGTKI